MKKVKRTKEKRIHDALEELNKAINMDNPHISIDLQFGVGTDKEGKEFVQAIKTFIEEYKKYYKMEKVEVYFFL